MARATGIDTIFTVDRHGESERYRARSESLEPKALLWHGSRSANFAGILAEGLRIAPPEAPMTGYMYVLDIAALWAITDR